MKGKSTLDIKGPAARVALGTVMISVSLILAGCGKQLARIEPNQLRLQAVVAPNAHQIGCIAPRIGQNQQPLHSENIAIGNNARLVAADMAAVADAQMKMQQTLQTNVQNLTNTLPILDQHQRNLHVEIRDVQSSTQAAAGL
jgi:hypothetical protein